MIRPTILWSWAGTHTGPAETASPRQKHPPERGLAGLEVAV